MLRLPREPSVTGMMVLAGLTGLVVSQPQPSWALAAALLLALHILTFDAAFDSYRAGKKGNTLFLVAANAAPYLAAAYVHAARDIIEAVGSAAALSALYLLLAEEIGWKNPYTYIAGSVIPTLPALTLPAFAGSVAEEVWLAWMMLSVYAASTAAYVESRLAFRSLAPWIALVIWSPALVIAASACKWLLVAAAEPTIKIVLNCIRNVKLSAPSEIKGMGWRELLRLLVYDVLLVAIITFAC